MLKWSTVYNRRMPFPIIVIGVALAIGIFHVLSYTIPFTDNAFVVTNVTPVAADVSGFISAIHVKNGEHVKKDQPIFTVYQPPYQLAYEQAEADYQEGIMKITVLEKTIVKTQALIKSVAAELAKVNYELKLKKDRYVAQAVSTLDIKKLSYDADVFQQKRLSLLQEVEVLQAQIEQQKARIASLKAQRDKAKINLDLTVVRAPADGVIDNMYVSINTPIKIHQPVFSFIDTKHFYIQANFNETDLRHVRIKDKAYIMLRMYYFTKIFHGEVVNSLWAAQRQMTAPNSKIQLVNNENEWLLLPQRFPVQIKILDPDPNFPLNPGASAYVYIQTQR